MKMNLKLTIILIVGVFAVVNGVALPNLKAPATKGHTACPQNGQLSPTGRSCWYVRNSTMDFVNAEMICVNNYGGHLASIHSVFDNMKLTQVAREEAALFGNNFYIGLNRLSGDDVWSYTDGSVVDYYDWAASEPVNGQKRDCVVVDIAYGFWYASNCYDEHVFVCQTPSNAN